MKSYANDRAILFIGSSSPLVDYCVIPIIIVIVLLQRIRDKFNFF